MQRFLTSAAIAFFLSACSHIPDPADAPKAEPYQILQSLRCEVRQAIATYPESHWVREAIIGYGLTLTAEENRNLTAGLLAVWPIHLGTVSLDASAGANRKRIGESQIDFAEALAKAGDEYCRPPEHARSVHFYPITGEVGLSEIIQRFVQVKEMGGAFTKDTGFVHTLEFTLVFNAGLTPSFSIAKVGNYQLSGNANFTADRSDKHKLIIKLEPPPVPEVKTVEIVKVQIVNEPVPLNPPPNFKPQRKEDKSVETRFERETRGQAAGRAERNMLRGIQEQRRLRLDEEIRDRIRDTE